METTDFLKVLQHFPVLSIKDAESVLTLKENFPFSQVLHTLCARVSKDHGFSNFQKELQLAAVYSADRAVLKEIIETDYASRSSESGQSENGTEPTDLANQVISDLQRLSTLRQNFELLFVDASASSSRFTSDATDPQPKAASDTTKSKKERIVELAKTLNNPEIAVLTPEPALRSRRRRRDAMDSFIDQIAVSKQEISIETEKQKEQIQLIDHFIRIQPSITGSKDKQILPTDLSSIKTGEFGDHIISETLVEILLKQGKKDKAVEVLKKLIWKFPQKKAYFAAQIEDLRK